VCYLKILFHWSCSTLGISKVASNVISLSSDIDIAIVNIYFSSVMTTLEEIGIVDMAKLMYLVLAV